MNFGDGVTVVTPVNLYGCAIGSNVFVGPFVEIQKEDGSFEKVDVELGLSDGINVEILEGVKEGDKIKVWNKASKENKPKIKTKTSNTKKRHVRTPPKKNRNHKPGLGHPYDTAPRHVEEQSPKIKFK